MNCQMTKSHSKIDWECAKRKNCYAFLEAVAIAMGDSFDENNNISREQAEIRIKKLKCQHCKLKEK